MNYQSLFKIYFLKFKLIHLLLISTSIFGFLVVIHNTAQAAINQKINVQGKLVDKIDGTNFSGACGSACNFQFTVFETCSVVPSQVSQETFTDVTVTDGIFNVKLGEGDGSIVHLLDFDDDDMCVRVELDADDNGSYEENFGTAEIAAVPQAFNSKYLTGIASTSFLRSDTSDNYTSGTLTFDNATILTAASGSTINVDGDLIVTDQTIVFDAATFSAFDLTGDLRILATGDDDDYIYFNTDTNVAGIFWSGTGAVTDPGIYTSGTELGYRDETDAWVSFDSLASGASLWTDGGTYLYPTGGEDIQLGDGDWIGVGTVANQPYLTFDDTGNYFEFMGGNVGIGTTSPNAELEIRQSTTPEARITWDTDTSYGLLKFYEGVTEIGTFQAIGTNFITADRRTDFEFNTSNATGDISFWTNNTHVATFKVGGNVGIGDTNPSETLDVVGNVAISGFLGVGTDPASNRRVEISHSSSDNSSPIMALDVGVMRSSATGDTSNILVGTDLVARNSAYYNHSGDIIGGRFGGQQFGNGTASYVTGGVFGVTPYAGTITTAIGGDFYLARSGGSGNVTTGYGARIRTPDFSPTTYYGLYIDNVAGSTAYSLYSNGGTSYFAGNVGIGTTSPDEKFEVEGTTDIELSVGNYPTIYTDYGSDAYIELYSGSNGNMTLATNFSTGDIILSPGSSGNVGIGTTDPYGQVEIRHDTYGDSANPHLLLDYNGTNFASFYMNSGWDLLIEGTNASSSIQLITPASQHILLSPGGNVGIKATTPETDLQVGTGRPVLVNGGSGTINIRGGAGGWATGYLFQGSAGTGKGGLWAYGSADALVSWNIGTTYDDGTLTIYPGGGVGIGDSTPTEAKLVVGSAGTGNIYATFATASAERLCWDASGASLITDCTGTPGDYAEYYGTRDSSLEAGDIVVADPLRNAEEIVKDGYIGSKAWVVKSSQPHQSNLIGIVSTQPNEVIGDNFNPEENPRPISLNGRVPVKVSSINGPIRIGDLITSSSIPGVGMKTTRSGAIIGKALEAYNNPNPNAIGKILVYINISWYEPDTYLTKLDQIISDYDSGLLINTGILDTMSNLTITNTFTANAINTQTINAQNGYFTSITAVDLSVTGNLSVTGILTSNQIKANELQAYDSENIIIKLSESLGDTAFEIQNSLGESVFKIDSTGKLSIKSDSENTSVGSGIIPIDQTELIIESNSVKSTSKVFITPRTNLINNSLYVDKVIDGSFKVKINNPDTYEIRFDWWVIN